MTSTDNQPNEAPFVIRIEHVSDGNSTFRPEATVRLGPDLRASGFLTAVPPDMLRDMLLLLTFTTPNGVCRPALSQLAEAMQTSEGKARSRMVRLTRYRAATASLATESETETGLVTYSPSPQVVAVETAPPVVPPSQAGEPYAAVPRETVIDASRERYAHPREDVERQIADLNGWDSPGDIDSSSADEADPGVREAFNRLLFYGVPKPEAAALMETYGPERVKRQLDWLPYRKAKHVSKLLAAAIEHDYDEPASLFKRHLVRKEVDDAPAE